MKTEELAERLQDTESVLQQQGKRIIALETKADKLPELTIPNYSAELNAIIKKLEQVSTNDKLSELTSKLSELTEKLKKQPPPVNRQFRILLFPETNQGQYYRIVFGRLIPCALIFMVITYIFLTGIKGIEIYRYNQDMEQSVHYEKAWLYLQQHAKKKTIAAMDEAYNQTRDK